MRKSGGFALAEQICSISCGHNTEIFLVFGSLLGIVRENAFMEYDNDLDFGVVINDAFSWEDLEKEMNKLGFEKNTAFFL